MATPGFLSKRVKKKSQTGLTTDRYEFLGLDQAEPDLGDPLVGISSIGANPAPIAGTQYVLISNSENTGKRYWVASSQLSGGGLIPGSFTVFNNSIQVGAANSFNKFNFVGTGVTVDFVGAAVTQQTGIATVRITVTDLVGPGNVNSISYKASNGLLAGASDFVYLSGNIGIGSTQPTVPLDVVGNARFTGIITASSFTGNLTGTATTATTANNVSSTININTSGIITASSFTGNLTGTATTATTANNVSSTININTSGIITASSFTGNLAGTATTATTALGFSTTASINTSGIITASSFTGNLTGTATTANNVSSTININTSGIITASTFYGNLVGNISTTGQSFNTISVIGLSTFANGPILVGRATTTGTATQALQVESGGYFNGSVGIGTTNPSSKLHVVGDGNFTGTVTATSFSGSGSNLTDLLSNTVSTSSTTAPQYIGFVSATSGTITSNLVSSTLTYIPSSGSLGIGTTNPRTPLQVETYGVKTGVGTFDASVGVSTTIDSFSVSSTDFKVAEYTVHIGFGSYIQAQKVLVTQDQSTAYSSEYAVVYNNSLIVSIGATISGGNCILQATPQTDISGLTTYRFARNTLL
jgi:hypothetical protein